MDLIFCLVTIFFVLASLNVVCGTNYCSICRDHIACGNSQKFSSNCPKDAKIVAISGSEQKFILEKMNKHRNFIAGGGDKNHSPACRMATMQWDNELAYLAELNVRQCTMEHDDCHDTVKFQYSGQNLAMSASSGKLNTAEELNRGIQSWYNEVSSSRMSYIKNYPAYVNGPDIGHFTVMIADKNTHVGCAASTYSYGGGYNTFLLACNFATTNMVDFPIYKDCQRPATDCKSGTNRDYPNLCSLSEAYNVNEWY